MPDTIPDTAVYGLWHGGTNYALGDYHSVERFTSVEAAGQALYDRATHGHWQPQDFHYANGTIERTLTPCADSDPEMRISPRHPDEESFDHEGIHVFDTLLTLRWDADADDYRIVTEEI